MRSMCVQTLSNYVFISDLHKKGQVWKTNRVFNAYLEPHLCDFSVAQKYDVFFNNFFHTNQL